MQATFHYHTELLWCSYNDIWFVEHSRVQSLHLMGRAIQPKFKQWRFFVSGSSSMSWKIPSTVFCVTRQRPSKQLTRTYLHSVIPGKGIFVTFSWEHTTSHQTFTAFSRDSSTVTIHRYSDHTVVILHWILATFNLIKIQEPIKKKIKWIRESASYSEQYSNQNWRIMRKPR